MLIPYFNPLNTSPVKHDPLFSPPGVTLVPGAAVLVFTSKKMKKVCVREIVWRSASFFALFAVPHSSAGGCGGATPAAMPPFGGGEGIGDGGGSGESGGDCGMSPTPGISSTLDRSASKTGV